MKSSYIHRAVSPKKNAEQDAGMYSNTKRVQLWSHVLVPQHSDITIHLTRKSKSFSLALA